MAKIKQINVNAPYLRATKTKGGIIMYILDNNMWQIDNGATVRGQTSSRFML